MKIAVEVIEGKHDIVAKYKNEILRDVILPSKQAHPAANFILVGANAMNHRARVATAYKQTNNIIAEDWPARSPHLSVIEYAWDMLQRATTSSKQPVRCYPRRVQQLGPEQAEAAGAERSKQVPWDGLSQVR